MSEWTENATRKLWLLIDADDTLWENSIYFDRAFEQFAEFLAHSELTPAEVREVLDEIELEGIREFGYGSMRFGRNMQSCFLRLAERNHDERDLDRVMAMAHRILDHPIVLLEGVEETLTYLADRHHLILFSKGQHEEQHAKFERSRLKPLFDDYRIVKEKTAEAYAAVVDELGMALERTWMVGNSPKSDIWPALEAGIGAVFVPHEKTWALERADLPERSERFQVVERFGDLRGMF